MKLEKKELNKYENDVIDIDELGGTDVKINPDFYIHHALIKAQNALANDDLKEGMQKYWIFIEHIETLCKAANLLTGKYHDDLKKWKEDTKIDEEKDKGTKNVKISMKKLELMMTEVFSHKVSIRPLKA